MAKYHHYCRKNCTPFKSSGCRLKITATKRSFSTYFTASLGLEASCTSKPFNSSTFLKFHLNNLSGSQISIFCILKTVESIINQVHFIQTSPQIFNEALMEYTIYANCAIDVPYAGNGKDLQYPCLDNQLSGKALQQLLKFDSNHIKKFNRTNHANITCLSCNTYTICKISEVVHF